jgi:hypothetical protein
MMPTDKNAMQIATINTDMNKVSNIYITFVTANIKFCSDFTRSFFDKKGEKFGNYLNLTIFYRNEATRTHSKGGFSLF